MKPDEVFVGQQVFQEGRGFGVVKEKDGNTVLVDFEAEQYAVRVKGDTGNAIWTRCFVLQDASDPRYGLDNII